MGATIGNIGKISINLSEHRKEPLRTPEELKRGVEPRVVVLVFKNGKSYRGKVGEVNSRHIWVQAPNDKGELSLPYRRLLGWYYEK